jgi:bifunctional UDP-N-acetylglucosamine pyrophosphorylase / glucosamine-1-phosphate N-acetyltransferase
LIASLERKPKGSTALTNIVILAAGQGKRMNSARPKVLHLLSGKPMLGHVIQAARALNPSRIVVVTGHGADEVEAAFANQNVSFVRQTEQLGTGHAVLQALPHIDAAAPTLVLYGDVPLISPTTLKRLMGGLLQGAAQAPNGAALASTGAANASLCVLTVKLADPKGYGRIVREGGEIRRIVEEKDASEAERAINEINTGIMLIPGGHIAGWLRGLSNKNAQGEYYLTDLVALAVRDGVPVASAHPDHSYETDGVNSRAQLAALERTWQRVQADALLEQGVALADPARIDVRGSLACGRDVSIDVNCVFEGEVVLGNDISIGANCVLKNVTVKAGTRIEAFSHLEEATIGAHCRIGPYARLRPGAVLDEHVHIGNFVEVKKSNIGAGSKANHLAYVGDSEVGRAVNIGAGTITCNYDGVNKSRTIIEDGAFIGSDSTLVAPVTIRAGAYIGAGSTITKEAPAAKLTLTRAKQMTIDAWKPPTKK